MKILHIITGLNTGGAEMMLYKLLGASVPELWQAEVICLGPDGPMAEAIRQLGIRVHLLGMRGSLPLPGTWMSLRRWAAEARPDVIQGWMYHGNLAATLAAGKGVPVLWNIRRSLNSWNAEKWATRAVIRAGAKLSRRPRCIIYNSYAGQETHSLLAGYAHGRSMVIPNGFDAAKFAPDGTARESFRKELALPPDTPLVGLVAGYRPAKDHRTFLTACGILRTQHPKVHFLLAGQGTAGQPEINSMLQALGIADRTHILGERRDMERITAALDIAVSSSRVEGFSNSIGEALCCAVPCVVTDVGDSLALVGDCGIGVPPSAPPEMASAILKLLAMSSLSRTAMGERGRKRMQALYSLTSVAMRYEEVYRQAHSVTLQPPMPSLRSVRD